MPFDIVREDLASGALVPLTLEGMDESGWLSMMAMYWTDTPPGPAGR